MSTKIQFLILRRMGIVSGPMLECGVTYQKVHEYKGERPGDVTRYLQERVGSANDYLIDVIVDGERIQSHSASEWLKCEWADQWKKIIRGEIKLENRQYQ